MKTFTIKKIEENLRKPSRLNFAVVFPDGELYIHEHGQGILECVYNNRFAYCDVTSYVREWMSGADSKRNTARNIKEEAELFYEERE